MPTWRTTAATAGGCIEDRQQIGTTVPAESKSDMRVATSSTVPEELQSIGLFEILDHDPRPSIVVDLDFTRLTGTKLQIVYCNAACKSWPLLDEAFSTEETAVPFQSATTSYSCFVTWSISAHEAQCSIDTSSISTSFCGLRWGYYTLKQRWRVIAASVCEQPVDGQVRKTLFVPTIFHEEDCTDDDSSRDLMKDPTTDQQSSTTNGTLIHTPVDLFSPWKPVQNYPPHIEFIRSIDWASKCMSASATWRLQLRQMMNMVVRDPNPALLFLGKDLAVMYNEPMIPILGSRHLQIMGQPCEKIFAEAWASQLEPILIEVQKNGQSFKQENVPLSVNKHGLLEESFFNYTFLPIIGADGVVAGIYQSLSEVTDSRLAQRRSSTLLQINANTAEATKISELWAIVLRAFEANPLDVPVALIYSAMKSTRNHATSSTDIDSTEVQEYKLMGSVGVPQGQLNIREDLDFRQGSNGLATLLYEASKSTEPLYSQIANDKLVQHLFEGLKERGFGEPCTAVVTASIRPTGKQKVSGFLLIGVSPRRPYDQEYQTFVRQLQRQLSSSAASVILLAEETRRGCAITEEAASGQVEFSAQDLAWTKEAELRERHLSQFAQHAPIGIHLINPEGAIYFANDVFYDMTGHPRADVHQPGSWRQVILEEDLPLAELEWNRLYGEHQPLTVELRLRKTWTPPGNSNEAIPIWGLFSCHVQMTREGLLESIVSCLTDISQQKWAEEVQKRRVNDALAMKQTQDEFIDMTSHEMRNPMGAVLQCADEIMTSLSAFTNPGNIHDAVTIPRDLLDSTIDASETISYCTLHQKRIVDDILTLSKMNSGMLPITPSIVQPLVVIKSGLEIFNRELRSSDIKLALSLEETFQKLAVDWVELDRGRMMQIFINIVANGIKFTKSAETRAITIKAYAFEKEPPDPNEFHIRYLPPKITKHDPTSGPDWGSGNHIFLEFTVQDTGPGLTDEEQKLLFQRFSQASRRTHVKYGGSGLGLHICQALAEMHGGRIGFHSEPGNGSVFGFYIKCRRASAESHAVDKDGTSSSETTEDHIRSVLPMRSPKGDVSVDHVSPSIKTVTFHDSTPNGRHKLHVMIVEDNVTNQKVLARQLERLGHNVAIANHGKEALEYIEKTEFSTSSEAADALKLDIILCDLEMPIMDGFDCVKTIRKLQLDGTIAKHIPVIAVTGNAREEQIAAAKAAGMDEVVLKPFKTAVLTPIMSHLVSKHPAPSSLTTPPPNP